MRLTAAAIMIVALAVAACDQPERIEANQAVPAAESPTAPAPDAVQTPEALIQAFYLEPSIPTVDSQARLYFTEDMAVRVVPVEGEEPVVDFDYRHDAQDSDLAALTVEELAAGPDGSTIIARFTNFGQIVMVAYDLCRRADGQWRIVDVRGVTRSWSLRQIAGASASPPETCA